MTSRGKAGAGRRRGVGRELMAKDEKDFTQKGITRIAMNTMLTRDEARAFYESLGYNETAGDL